MLSFFRLKKIINILWKIIPVEKKLETKKHEYGGTFKSVIRKKIRIITIRRSKNQATYCKKRKAA